MIYNKTAAAPTRPAPIAIPAIWKLRIADGAAAAEELAELAATEAAELTELLTEERWLLRLDCWLLTMALILLWRELGLDDNVVEPAPDEIDSRTLLADACADDRSLLAEACIEDCSLLIEACSLDMDDEKLASQEDAAAPVRILVVVIPSLMWISVTVWASTLALEMSAVAINALRMEVFIVDRWDSC
jgi:hypothetical protein